jgi:SusD family.
MLGILATAYFTACTNDFLKENLITKDSTQSFETEAGLDKLGVGIYQNFEHHFNYEFSYMFTQYGTDEMSVGNDAVKSAWNNYTDGVNPAVGWDLNIIWDNMYSGISSANILIKNVPLFYNENSPNYQTRLGEGYFVRGFNYFFLVNQFGGVPLVTTVIEGAQTDFQRNTVEECYELILSDLKAAYDNLPETPSETGRLTKYVAAHFLAKASLFRASEVNDSWNAAYKQEDLNTVIKYAQEVIAAHPLCNDYIELWDFQKPNGPNESVSEVVFAAQFSDDPTTYGRYGNQIHLHYPSVYQNIAGMKRDISGDREFSRMRTTNYTMDVFDRVNDSRFWKSFITSYRCNNPSAAPKWEEGYAPAGKNSGEPRFTGGEESILYIVNDPGDDRYTAESLKYRAPHMYVRYFTGETKTYLEKRGNMGQYEYDRSRYVALSKFRDGSRGSVGEQKGQRDGILARSAEDYLMIAEALGRQGKYGEALPYINKLRERAGYKDGEDRSKHADGGQAYKNNTFTNGDSGSGTGFAAYSETNTYFESNNMTPGITGSTKNELMFTSTDQLFNSNREFYDVLGVTGQEEKFLTFILNERTREFCGELIRWIDLARTKTLEKRFKLFNDGSTQVESGFNPNKHYLRPIPQSFLDAITKDGKALSASEKQAIQNPGY